MKLIVLTMFLSIVFSACSGEFYELKKSPCACIDNASTQSQYEQKEVNKNVYL